MDHEMFLFAHSVGMGMCLLFAYDWLRILRRLIPHSGWAVSAGDFCYWIVGGLSVFSMMYRRNDGVIRSYALLGIVLGMVLYHVFLSGFITAIAVKILYFPVEFVKSLLKRLLFAVRRCKLFMYTFFGRIIFLGRLRRRRTDRSGENIGKRLLGIGKKGHEESQ